MIRKALLIKLIALISTLFWSSSALCEVSIDFLSRWPYAPVKAIAVDNNEDPEWIFLGYGNFIDVLDVNLGKQASKEITSSGQVMGIYYSAGYLYVACANEGLKIINVSDPLDLPDPVVYDTDTDTDIDARDVYVLDGYAYILEDFVIGVPKIEILDISDPLAPIKSGEVVFDTDYIAWALWSETREIYVAGGYAYVTDIINGLHIIDVSVPKDSEYVTAFLFENANVYGVNISDPIAYVAGGGGGLLAVDISDPLTEKDIRVLGQYPDPLDEDTLIEAVGVRVVGDYAYVADRSGGLQVINIPPSDPGSLTKKGAFTTDMTGAYSVHVGGNHAYVKDDWIGLSKIDVSDPTNPVQSAAYDTAADAWDLYVSEEEDTITAYVVDTRVGIASDEEGLRIIDVSAALLPELKGFLPTPGEAQGVFVADKYAYVADGSSGLRIIDVSNPASPTDAGSLDTDGHAKGVYVSGDYAYVADGEGGLKVIYVSDKDSPSLIDSFDTADDALDVFVSRSYAYVACGNAGIQILDISDPDSIEPVETVDTDNALAVYVSDSHAYVADGESGIKIIDVSNPAAPGAPVGLDTTNARGIFVMEDIAFVADGAGGIRVVDVSDPNNPQELRSWDTAGDATGVFASVDFTYLADGPGGLIVLEHSFDSDPPITELPEESGGGGCFITTAF